MSDSQTRIPGWLLPAGLAVLVVALVAIALLRGPTVLDPDTPEGTVQEYLLSISEERWDDAVDVIHEDWRGECDGRDLASNARQDFTAELGNQTGFGGASSVRETFRPDPEGAGEPPPTIPDETTTVEVTIHYNEDPGLGPGWNESVFFELVDQDDFWWLVDDPWPYFVWSCQI